MKCERRRGPRKTRDRKKEKGVMDEKGRELQRAKEERKRKCAVAISGQVSQVFVCEGGGPFVFHATDIDSHLHA